MGGLAHAGLAQDGAVEFLDVIGVQSGLGGLFAALGDEVFFAGGVIDREFLGVFEGDDLLDRGMSLAEEADDLLVDRIDLAPEGFEGGGHVFFGGLMGHGSGVGWLGG